MDCEKDLGTLTGNTGEVGGGSAYRERDAIMRKLRELERNASEAKGQLLYLRAEIDNFRKSADREIEELRWSGNAALLRRLLPIVHMLDFYTPYLRSSE
jgi:molecular chaperone GrpE (heat shock protein)